MMGIDDIFISFITSYITGMIDRLAELMMKRDTAFGTQHIRRGLTKHKAVDGYIRRYCSSDQSESNFIYYFLEGKERHILADYVVGLEEVPLKTPVSRNGYCLLWLMIPFGIISTMWTL